METVMLNQDDASATTNTETVEQDKVTPEAEPEKEEVKADTQQPEETEKPVVEVDGEKLTASQIKKWKEDYTNDSKWRAKNTQESQALKLEKEALKKESEELAQVRALKPLLEQRPEILQQLFNPQPKRDFQTEFQQLQNTQPDPSTDPNGYNQWALKVERLRIESIAAEVREQTRAEQAQAEMSRHTQSVTHEAIKKYKESGKLSEGEMIGMGQWISQNLQAQNGRIPDNAYDIAYKVLYEDKYRQDIALDATQRAIDPILKANKPKPDAIRKADIQPTVDESEDAAFHDQVKARSGKRWVTVQ